MIHDQGGEWGAFKQPKTFMSYNTSHFVVHVFAGTGRILTPVATLLVPDDEDMDNATETSNSISIEAAVSKVEISCPHTDAATSTEEKMHSVAQALRNRMTAELVQTATRLF